MKTATEQALTGYKLARRLGTTPSKRIICPGCGKVHNIDGAVFALRVEAGQIIPAPDSKKADGVQWCRDCDI